MESNVKRAATYCRLATLSQDQPDRLSQQVADCLAYAASRGYTVTPEHIYQEIGTGTGLTRRPQMALLREAIRRGELGVLVCPSPDRLTRSSTGLNALLAELKRHKVGVEFAAGSVPEVML